MLDIEHVTKVFFPGTVNEKVALENINLHVEKGDVICVIGSNGSGKSTLFNMIAGTFPVTNGTIRIDGRDITNAPEYKRAFFIGRIFQDPTKGTSANMSIEDNMNLAYTKGMKGLRFGLTAERRKEFRKLLEPIGLADRMADNVGLLSGGQRQALTLLMATLSQPSLMLLDEHTAALDPKTADIIMSLTDSVVKEKKLTTVMVTHNLRYAVEYGNRLIMMHKGNIVIDKAGEEKEKTKVDDILNIFNEISIECGN